MSNPSSTLHLALAFDQNFVTPLYVLLTSIFDNNAHNQLHIHAVATGVSQAERQAIVRFVESRDAHLSFYEIDESYVASFATFSDVRYGLAVFYRLLLPAMLPANVRKLIYIDVDTIVVGDLVQLYNIPLTDVPVAAVADPVEWDRPDLGIPDRANYFNSGVLLINIDLWKQQQIAEKAINFLKQYPEKATYVDQDALNAVLIGNWKKLDDKFNYTYRVVPVIPRKDLEKIVATKVIIHYNESAKPWHRHSASPLKYLYHQYFIKSPVAHQSPYFPVKISKQYLYKSLKYSLLNLYLQNETLVRVWRKIKSS
jgi:lipopolysaccharide biosynthesis glycosyltransferase